jgi:hypothetical protein
MNPRSAASRLVLIPDPRPVPSNPSARRYRLARLELNPRPRPAAERFAHLKRVYD